jgi:hypothetical protein
VLDNHELLEQEKHKIDVATGKTAVSKSGIQKILQGDNSSGSDLNDPVVKLLQALKKVKTTRRNSSERLQRLIERVNFDRPQNI